MLKRIAATLLLLCCMAQTFSRAAMVGSYYVNTADYAKSCINKAKPMLHCNGKCQLMKKLKQEEKKDTQNPERRSKENVLSSKSHFASLLFVKTNSLSDHFDYYGSFTIDRPNEIFHPPGR